jgi:hypothetical protein
MGTLELQQGTDERGRALSAGYTSTSCPSQHPGRADHNASPCCEGWRDSFRSLHARLSISSLGPPQPSDACLCEVLAHVALGMRAYSSHFGFPRRCAVLKVLDTVTTAVKALAQHPHPPADSRTTPAEQASSSAAAQANCVNKPNDGYERRSISQDAPQAQAHVVPARKPSASASAEQADLSNTEPWAALCMAWQAIQNVWDAVCESILTGLPSFVSQALKEASVGDALELALACCTHAPAIVLKTTNWLHEPVGFGHHGLKSLSCIVTESQLAGLQHAEHGHAVPIRHSKRDSEHVGQRRVLQTAQATAQQLARQKGTTQVSFTPCAREERPCGSTLEDWKELQIFRCPTLLHCAGMWGDFDDRVALQVDWSCAPRSHSLVSKALQTIRQCSSGLNPSTRAYNGSRSSMVSFSNAADAHLVVFVHGFAGLSTDLRVLCNHIREAVPGARTLCLKSFEVRLHCWLHFLWLSELTKALASAWQPSCMLLSRNVQAVIHSIAMISN